MLCIKIDFFVMSAGPPGKRGRRGDPGESCFFISADCNIQAVLSHCVCLSNDDSEVLKSAWS